MIRYRVSVTWDYGLGPWSGSMVWAYGLTRSPGAGSRLGPADARVRAHAQAAARRTRSRAPGRGRGGVGRRVEPGGGVGAQVGWRRRTSPHLIRWCAEGASDRTEARRRGKGGSRSWRAMCGQVTRRQRVRGGPGCAAVSRTGPRPLPPAVGDAVPGLGTCPFRAARNESLAPAGRTYQCRLADGARLVSAAEAPAAAGRGTVRAFAFACVGACGLSMRAGGRKSEHLTWSLPALSAALWDRVRRACMTLTRNGP